MYRIGRFRRGVAVYCLTAQLAACTTWRVESVAPADLIEQKHPAEVRVDAADGSRRVFHRPEVRGDSLWGSKYSNAKQADRAVALEDVTAVATHHTSTGKTVLLFLGIGATVMAAVVVAFAATYDGVSFFGQ